MRITSPSEPQYDRTAVFHETSPFAARWVAHPDAPPGNESDAVFACRYALSFTVPEACTIRVHVSADERYVLTLDDQPLGRGPERGTVDHYCFETYELRLTAGEHRLAAQVHSLGRHRPYAQVSVRHAFVLMAEGEFGQLISTGVAPWRAARVDGYSPLAVSLPNAFHAVGARFRIDAAGLHAPADWRPVVDAGPFVLASMRMESPGRWQLAPASLPAMLERPVTTAGVVRRIDGPGEPASWQALLASNQPLMVPPNANVRVLIDLDDHHCVYPRLAVHGGAGTTINLAFAEALFEPDGTAKRQRDQVDGLRFGGMGDDYVCDGTATTFEPPWWLAGRYVQLAIQTVDEPLRIASLAFIETRYPYSWDSQIATSDAAINAFLPITRRAIEMCAHDTFVDCPYYEQLMYVGDARLDALVTYSWSADDRLPRKAIATFDRSRTTDGWTQARSPTKTSQVIPPFSWWWIGMVHDLAMWRDRPDEVRRAMPGVRAVMEATYARLDSDGLYRPTTGWNFVDWVPGWPHGVPPGASGEPSAPLHFHVAYAAKLAGELEAIVGEPLLAQRHRQQLERLNAAGRGAFYDAKVGLFADDRARLRHSEHAQCLALLAGAVADEERDLFAAALVSPGTSLARTTIYFSHYLFEAFRALGRIDAMFDRLGLWTGLKAAGFRTTPESPEPARSDCHGWGAHPMYHLYASVLGVRPASAGFGSVEIAPQLGPLKSIEGTLVHPRGEIRIAFRRVADGRLDASVQLPAGVSGTLELNGERRAIASS